MDLALKRRQSENVLISDGEADAEGRDLCQCARVWARKHTRTVNTPSFVGETVVLGYILNVCCHQRLAVNGSRLKFKET